MEEKEDERAWLCHSESEDREEFEFILWDDLELDEKRDICTYFFTFESDEDFEDIAGPGWWNRFLPIAISKDIDDLTHEEWDDFGGGLLLEKNNGAIYYFYHEMMDNPKIIAASLEELFGVARGLESRSTEQEYLILSSINILHSHK